MTDEMQAALVARAKAGSLTPAERIMLEEAGYVVGSREAYPTTIHKLPTRVIGHTVLAWATVKNKEGNYPGGYVLAHNPDEVQPYVVWLVCTPDGGETWRVGYSGEYSFVHEDALNEFMLCLAGEDIATEALTPPPRSPLWQRIGRMSDDELGAILEHADDSTDLWDAANSELEKRDDQRAANNGEMNGVTPEF